MAKSYRSARGKNIDLSQVLHDNENVRAVGNMNVNARGDTLDSQNNTVQSRNERIRNQYRKQHKNTVVDDVVPTSKRHAEKIANMEAQLEQSKSEAVRVAEEYTQEKMKVETVQVSKPAEAPAPSEVAQPEPTVNPMTTTLGDQAKVAPQSAPEPAQETAAKAEEPEPQANAKPAGGLAAAIAKARESKQELMKTERQQARESSGVKRI
jgi:hypothetical protein